MNKLERARELQNRTKQFALRIMHCFTALPKNEAARVIGRPFLRSGTSVAANYRAACRARSLSEFIAKMGVVVKEADETLFWLGLLIESRLVAPKRLELLRKENVELRKIFSSSLTPPNPIANSLNHQLTQ